LRAVQVKPADRADCTALHGGRADDQPISIPPISCIQGLRIVLAARQRRGELTIAPEVEDQNVRLDVA
jgi:hypothetical protein